MSANLRRNQSGATAVEFALVSAIFFTLLLGALEVGRLLFIWNTVAEGTRWGARVAAVCDLNDADIRARVVQFVPNVLVPGDVTVTYEPAGCSIDTCQTVTVTVNRVTPIQTFIPFIASIWTLPQFRTTLTRESLQSSWPGASGGANPVCQ